MGGTTISGSGTAIALYPEPLTGAVFEGADGNVEFSSANNCWEFVRIGPGGQYAMVEDFSSAPGSTLPDPWATQTTSTAGSPTLDYVANAPGGQYAMKLTADNEVQAATLYHGDHRTFDPTKRLRVEFRIKVDPDVAGGSGNLGSGDKILIGLASARASNPDDIAESAWFILTGADKVIRYEADDGTANVDDQTPADSPTWTAGGWLALRIDMHDPSDVQFILTGVGIVGTADMSDAVGPLQPFVEVRKAAAANNDHRVTVDYVGICQWAR